MRTTSTPTTTPDRRSQAAIDRALSRLREADRRMSTYQSGEAGPAIDAAIYALVHWADRRQEGDREPALAAKALRGAADAIKARKGWPHLMDCPWLGWKAEVRRLTRTAGALASPSRSGA